MSRARRQSRQPVARQGRMQIGESGASPMQADTGLPSRQTSKRADRRIADLGGRMGSRPIW
jgi:hypothetical protein